MSLNEIPAEGWTPIARQTRAGDWLRWEYEAGCHVSVQAERDAGRLVTCVSRVDGVLTLLGRRVG